MATHAEPQISALPIVSPFRQATISDAAIKHEQQARTAAEQNGWKQEGLGVSVRELSHFTLMADQSEFNVLLVGGFKATLEDVFKNTPAIKESNTSCLSAIQAYPGEKEGFMSPFISGIETLSRHALSSGFMDKPTVLIAHSAGAVASHIAASKPENADFVGQLSGAIWITPCLEETDHMSLLKRYAAGTHKEDPKMTRIERFLTKRGTPSGAQHDEMIRYAEMLTSTSQPAHLSALPQSVVVATKDRFVKPESVRSFADHIKADTLEVPVGHGVMSDRTSLQSVLGRARALAIGSP